MVVIQMSIINQMLKDLENRSTVSVPISEPILRDSRKVKSDNNYWLPITAFALAVITITITFYLYLHFEHKKPLVSTSAFLVSKQTVTKPKVEVVIKQVPMKKMATVQNKIINEKISTLIFEDELKDLPQLNIENSQNKPVNHDTDVKFTTPGTIKHQLPIKNLDRNTQQLPDNFVNQPSVNSKSNPVPLKEVRLDQRSANLYRQAVLFLQQGRVSEARTTLTKALEINPINNEARQTLAGLLLDNKQNDDARKILQEGIQLAPEQNGFRMALSRLQLDAGDNVLALSTMEQGLNYAKNDAEYYGYLATLLQRAERHNDAIKYYQIALSKEPNMVTSLVGYGISLQTLGRLSEAKQAFDRAQSNENLSPELSQFVDEQQKLISQHLH